MTRASGRRVLLKSVAGVVTAVCVGALRPLSGLAGESSAGNPWEAWTPQALSQHREPRLRAIAHAILSPNPQNLQPWLCELQGTDRIVLRHDGKRRLPASDANDRQLTVGFGAFSELLIMAAKADGHVVDLELFPQGEPWPLLDQRPVAVFTFRKSAADRDPLLDHILTRHTNRTPFDETRKVTEEQLAAIRAAVHKPERIHTNLDPVLAAKIKDITLRAYETTIGFAPTREEVARYTHIGNVAIAAAPYGPFVSDAALAKAAGPVSYETLSDPHSAQFQANRAGYRKAVQSGWAHLWIAAPAGDRAGMFDAGRDWARAHLQATALGLDMQPHSQSIQNFPEIDPYVREIHDILDIAAPGRIHMLGRIGYGATITPSPRLSATAHIQV